MREIIVSCQESGFQTRAIWGLINEQKPYLKEKPICLRKHPIMRIVFLIFPRAHKITIDEIKYVSDCIKRILMGLQKRFSG